MKNKKVPMRTCVVTHKVKPKNELMRIVVNKEGEVFVDPTGKQNGRGAYITLNLEIIEKAKLSKLIDKKLKTEVPDKVYEALKKYV